MATFARFERASTGTVYTADSSDVIIGCMISNTGASATADVTVTLNGTSLATNLKIPAGGAVELVQGKIVAVNTDDLVFTLNSGAASIYLSVLDSAS